MTPAELYTALTTQWAGAPDEIIRQATGEGLDIDACARARSLVEYLAAVHDRTQDPHTARLIADHGHAAVPAATADHADCHHVAAIDGLRRLRDVRGTGSPGPPDTARST
jgi:hypothetical protein